MTDQEKIVEIVSATEDNKSSKTKKKRKSSPKSSPSKSIIKKYKKKIEEQDEKYKKLFLEKEEYKDKYLRNLAEIDNFRKRIRKEKEDYQKYALSEFLIALLPISDNLERALNAKNATKDEESIISGVEMIYRQLQNLLKKYHVIEIESLNKPFDPVYHQAISKIEKEEIEEPIVIEVYQKGFLYNEKLLRPAFVQVAIPKEEKLESENN